MNAIANARAALAQAQPLSRAAIREIFVAHGFTVKEGQTDLKPYVYAAADALICAALATQAAQPEHVSHTAAGFRGAMIGLHGLKPTEQEIWDAAIRSYRNLNPAQPVQAQGVLARTCNVDCIGLALALEDRLKTVESQTTERAMKAAANGLRLLAAAPQAAPQQAEPLSEEPDLAHPQYRAGWNDAMNSMTKAMLRPSGIGTKGAK